MGYSRNNALNGKHFENRADAKWIPDLNERVREPEVMDDPGLPLSVHHEALEELGKIFWLSRTSHPIWKELRKFSAEFDGEYLRGVDLGSGPGDLPIALSERARHENRRIHIDGTDISPDAIVFARRKAQSHKSTVRFFRLDMKHDSVPGPYDFVISSLLLHHLSEEETLHFFTVIRKSNVRFAVFSDLIRSRQGFMLAYLASRIFCNSEVVRRDALLSVKAAYTIPEIRRLAASAGMRDIEIKKIWPERFLLIWRR
jgi:2-polyprenyl-3-methyl-5-hydroxy-6-metoxy-1,4-benzoquinol methylase